MNLDYMQIDSSDIEIEKKWLELIRKGDESAFEKLFKEYYLALTQFAWNFTGSKAIAEELVQDLFADIWEKRETWKCFGDLRPYLFRVIKEKCLDHLKHQKVKHKYDGQWMEQWVNSSVEFEVLENDEQLELIRKAIQKAVEELPLRGKMIYKLHKYNGLTYPDIADVMNITIKTVESQMSRVLKMLRENLAYLIPFLFLVVMAL